MWWFIVIIFFKNQPILAFLGQIILGNEFNSFQFLLFVQICIICGIITIPDIFLKLYFNNTWNTYVFRGKMFDFLIWFVKGIYLLGFSIILKALLHSWVIVLVFYCCITNYHKFTGLKCLIFLSQFPLVKNLGIAHLGPLPWHPKAAVKVSAEVHSPQRFYWVKVSFQASLGCWPKPFPCWWRIYGSCLLHCQLESLPSQWGSQSFLQEL